MLALMLTMAFSPKKNRRAPCLALPIFMALFFCCLRPVRGQAGKANKFVCTSPTDPTCCPQHDSIVDAIVASKDKTEESCLGQNYKPSSCCEAIQQLVAVTLTLDVITILSQKQTCFVEIQEALIQLTNTTMAPGIAVDCQLSLGGSNPVPNSLPCPVNDPEQVGALVQRTTLGACTAANPEMACVGNCWTAMLRTIDGLVAQDPGSVNSLPVKQGCLQGILNYFRRMEVDQSIINALTTCPIRTSRAPPSGPRQGFPFECPVKKDRLYREADMNAVFSTCNDNLPPSSICTSCLSALYKASSQLLIFSPEEQKRLVGGCFIMVMNELVLNLPVGSYLPDQIEKCVAETSTKNFTKSKCPVADVNKLPEITILTLDSACDAINLRGGSCLICQGNILPAVLSIPGLDPRNEYVMSECITMVTTTFISLRAQNVSHAYDVTNCFKATTEALAPGISPYDADEQAPFPDFPLETPKAAPAPTPELAPAPMPGNFAPVPSMSPMAIITNITTVDPNKSNSRHRHTHHRHLITTLAISIALLIALSQCDLL